MLQGLHGVICRVDDILVATDTLEKHKELLESVFTRLREANLKVRRDKCKFLQRSITYLGHVISAEGIKADPQKISAIVKAKTPTNVTEVQSLCGFINYYSNFIPGCSQILYPLYNLTKKGVTFTWSDECEQAFQTVKRIITSNKVLTHYDPNQQLKLACDASYYGIGAVLSQVDRNGLERPIGFASRTMSTSEQNYSQLEKESLSIIFGITKFHDYLLGNHFIVETDHQPLVTIFGSKTGIPTIAASRLQRWSLKLSAHNYTLVYRKGKLHNNADLLSRLPLPFDDEERMTEGCKIQNLRINSLPVSAQAVSKATRNDKILSAVLSCLRTGNWPERLNMTDEMHPYYLHRNELTIEQDILLRGCRVVIPSSLQGKVLDQLHDTHPGICRMKGIARTHVWWPNIDRDIEKVVRSCENCQMQQATPPAASVHPLVWPNIPWYRLHIDFAGPFYGYYWLIVVDATSKWPEIIPMKEATSSSTIRALESVFARFGLPVQLFSDNGTTFTSNEFSEFTRRLGIKHIFSSPFHPRSNGEAERMVRTFKCMVKKEDPDSREIFSAVSKMLLAYRTTPHNTTGASPFEILFKGCPRTLMHLLHPSSDSRVLANQFSQRDRTIKKKENRSFLIGEKVYVKDFRKNNPNNWASGTILALRGPLSYLVQVESNVWRRHVDQIRGAEEDGDATIANSEDSHLGPTGETVLSKADNDAEEMMARNLNPTPATADGESEIEERAREDAETKIEDRESEENTDIPGEPNANPDDVLSSQRSESDAKSSDSYRQVPSRYPIRARKEPNWFLPKGGR